MNYHEEMLKILEQVKDQEKTILLHTCCAPCSTRALELLSAVFKVTVFYYNPNIEPQEEYLKRKEEQIRLLKEYPSKYKIEFLDCDYDPVTYHERIKGLESEPERGKRCYICYELRLEKTAQKAKELGFDYFGTSLTVSPFKNSNWLNEIGEKLSKELNIPYLYSDFKKEDGYKKSILNSKKYNLYRQDFCGCIYSKKERETYKLNKEKIS